MNRCSKNYDVFWRQGASTLSCKEARMAMETWRFGGHPAYIGHSGGKTNEPKPAHLRI